MTRREKLQMLKDINTKKQFLVFDNKDEFNYDPACSRVKVANGEFWILVEDQRIGPQWFKTTILNLLSYDNMVTFRWTGIFWGRRN